MTRPTRRQACPRRHRRAPTRREGRPLSARQSSPRLRPGVSSGRQDEKADGIGKWKAGCCREDIGVGLPVTSGRRAAELGARALGQHVASVPSFYRQNRGARGATLTSSVTPSARKRVAWAGDAWVIATNWSMSGVSGRSRQAENAELMEWYGMSGDSCNKCDALKCQNV